ncbi:MAG: glycosyltransferase family A protein [Reyranellaceae bacterium]
MTRRAILSGLVRNCERHLPRSLDNLDRFASTYDAAYFLFMVSDSDDGSRELLERWLASGRQGEVVDHGHLAERWPRRTERLALLRNMVIESVGGSRRRDWEHLVIADLDNVLESRMPVEPFIAAGKYLDEDPRRAAVFANAFPLYYDVWALRHPLWCPYDCWHRIWGRRRGQSFEAAKFREVFARQIAISDSMAPIPVRSAFGGLGIYRLSFALQAHYCGTSAEGLEVSEHVAFNEAIAALGGELCIFPPLQVRAPPEHLYAPAEFKRRWRLRMSAIRVRNYFLPPVHSFLKPLGGDAHAAPGRPCGSGEAPASGLSKSAVDRLNE